MRSFILISSAILQGGSFVAVQAKSSFWMVPSPSQIHHHPPSLRTTTGAYGYGAEDTTAFASTRGNNAGCLQHYKMNNYVSIIQSLRLRGGDGGSDGAADDDAPRRRRRRRKKKDAENKDEPSTTNPSEDDEPRGGSSEQVVDDTSTTDPPSNEDEAASSKKRVKKRRRRLSQMFAKGANVLNDGGDDEDYAPSMGEETSAASKIKEDGEDVGQTSKSDDIEGGGSSTRSLRTDDMIGPDVTKKKRRRRVRKEFVEQNDAIDQNAPSEPIDSVPQERSIEVADTAASRTKQKRRKRRAEQKVVSDVPPIDASVTSVGSTIEPIDNQLNLRGVSLAEDTDSSNGNMKTKRKRKRRSKVDTHLPNNGDKAGEMPSPSNDTDATKSENPFIKEDTEHQSDLSKTITVDASIEIPNEEIVPESIGASVELEGSMPITDPPLEAEVDGPPSLDEGSESLIADTKKKRRKRRKPRIVDEHISSYDYGDAASTESESPPSDIESKITTAIESPGSIEIDASIEIPNEEIVPESIGTSVEIEENVMPVDPIIEGDRTAGESPPNVEVLAAKDQKQLDSSSTVNKMEDEEDLESEKTSKDVSDETSALAGLIGDETPLKDDGNESNIDLSESIRKEGADQSGKDVPEIPNTVEALQSPISIDASIELPGEEIVPESVGATVEIEENNHGAESEVDALVLDGSPFDVAFNSDVECTGEKAGATETSAEVPAQPPEIMHLSDEEDAKEGEVIDNADSHPLVEDDAPNTKQIDLVATDEIVEETDGEDISIEDGAIGAQEEVRKEEDTADAAGEEGSITKEEDALSDGVTAKPQVNDQIDDGTVETFDSTDGIASKQCGETTQTEKVDQTMDKIDTEKMDDDCLTLSVVTWNLAEAAPSEKEASFFRRFRKKSSSGMGSDLVMIGAQECEEIKPRRMEGHRSRHLRRMGIMMLGKEYVPLAIHSLGGIQCALYCHRDVLADVEMINIADVTCGVGNVLHNKGAIGVYLKMKRSSSDGLTKSSRMLFITGHLAAHVKNVDARDNDFKRIISELEAQAPTRFLRPMKNHDGSPAECDGTHLLSMVDHVFFAGDLNYRIDLPREYVERCIIDIQHSKAKVSTMEGADNSDIDALMKRLLRRDQLLQTIASGRAFSDFSEGKITFLPTFKFDKGTKNYDTSHKQRVPSWTDRIVFRSKKVRVLEYRSADEAKHSDHRPVFGTFQLGWGLKGKLSRKPKSKSRRR